MNVVTSIHHTSQPTYLLCHLSASGLCGYLQHMHAARTFRSHNRHFPAWIAAWCCFVAWVFSGSILSATAVAVLAGSDGQHQAACTKKGGRLTIVLRHAAITRSAAHGHSGLSLIFAEAPTQSAGMADHLLAFTDSGVPLVSATLRLIAPPTMAPRLPIFIAVPNTPVRALTTFSRHPHAFSGTPPYLRCESLRI